MNRESGIRYIENNSGTWDIIVIGGGATGLGIAVDATLRGYKTLLLEKTDFTKGTSSRSTKLVHGGVRYLQQGNIKLVLEALYERGLLLKNAPHLTSNQSFVIPGYNSWASFYYTIGLKLYDLLSGKRGLGKSELIGSKKVKNLLPTVVPQGLKNGVMYHDGQFDDSRLGINLAQSCTELGGHVLNYFQVTGLKKNTKKEVSGVLAKDLETGKSYSLPARVVINATGVFVDEVLSMDTPGKAPIISPSQGTHIVLDRSFLPTDHALMIPKTSDGRVLFAVPWHNKIIAGTTDVLVESPSPEPKARDEEVDFILSTLSRYLVKKPQRKDVLSVFTGLRPLVRPEKAGKKTKEISRNHKIIISQSKLISVTGGKWTTYRKMAEDTVNKAIKIGSLPKNSCKTHHYKIHGYFINSDKNSRLHIYGSDAERIMELMDSEPGMKEKLDPSYSFTKAEVVWAVREEMARTVEDVLARRLRVLFMDARAAMRMSPVVAKIMAKEMEKDADWSDQQVKVFNQLAKGYLV